MTKSELIGFHDPCCKFYTLSSLDGEKKTLVIKYSHQGRLHKVEVSDEAPLHCPQLAHLIEPL